MAGLFRANGLWAVTGDNRLLVSDDRAASWRAMGATVPRALAVERTADGGATWQASTLPGTYLDVTPSLVLLDAQHGYVLLSSLGGHRASTVLRSDDGGRTWRAAGGLP